MAFDPSFGGTGYAVAGGSMVVLGMAYLPKRMLQRRNSKISQLKTSTEPPSGERTSATEFFLTAHYRKNRPAQQPKTPSKPGAALKHIPCVRGHRLYKSKPTCLERYIVIPGRCRSAMLCGLLDRWCRYDNGAFRPVVWNRVAVLQQLIAHMREAHLRLMVPVPIRVVLFAGLLKPPLYDHFSQLAPGWDVPFRLAASSAAVQFGMECDRDEKLIVFRGRIFRERQRISRGEFFQHLQREFRNPVVRIIAIADQNQGHICDTLYEPGCDRTRCNGCLS